MAAAEPRLPYRFNFLAAAKSAAMAKVAAAEATEGFEFLAEMSADEVRAGELQRATANGEVISFDSPSLPSAKRMRMPPSPLRAPSGAPRAASDGGSGSNAPGRPVQVEMC